MRMLTLFPFLFSPPTGNHREKAIATIKWILMTLFSLMFAEERKKRGGEAAGGNFVDDILGDMVCRI